MYVLMCVCVCVCVCVLACANMCIHVSVSVSPYSGHKDRFEMGSGVSWNSTPKFTQSRDYDYYCLTLHIHYNYSTHTCTYVQTITKQFSREPRADAVQ